MSWFSGPSKPNPVIIGYRYYLGMHMITGHGNIDACEKIKVGEKVVWDSPDTLHNYHNTNDNNKGIINTAAHPLRQYAQTFTTSQSYICNKTKIKIYEAAGGSFDVKIELQDTDISGHPNGNILTYGTISGADISTSAQWLECIFTTYITLDASKKYALVVYPIDGSGEFRWRVQTSASFPGGSYEATNDGGTTWVAVSTNNFMFEMYHTEGVAPNHTITVNQPNIFGGNKKEGGIYGNVDLMFGDTTQTQNSYLVSKLDSNISAFRGLMSFILNRVYVGTSPYLKPWSFFCKRTDKQISGDTQWYADKAVIRPNEDDGDDLNPAHVIRECLIDPEWGLGWTSDDIDDTLFRRAADILFNEDFGVSILWDQIQPLEDFVDTILRYIAGFLYQDLETGKWCLVLTRGADWEKPTSYTDPDSEWQGETRIYDGKTDTGAICKNIGAWNWTSWLELNLTEPLLCNKIKFNVKKFSPYGGSQCEVEVYYEGAWHSVYGDKLHTSYQDYIVSFSEKEVSKARIRLENSYGVGVQDCYCYEFAFFNSSTVSSNVETFNEDDIIAIEDYDRPSYGEIVNQVVVNWWDKIAHKSRPAEAHDIALIQKQGNVIIELVHNYYGICNATLANKVVERELKLATSMLATMRIKATRKMAHLKPNNTFRLTWNDLDITQMNVRVLEADYGNLDRNEIYLNCIEDVFSAAETIYGDAPDTEWTDPISDPVDATNTRVVEIPYWSLCNELESQSIVDSYDNDDIGFMFIMAAKPVLDAFDFNYLIQYEAGDSFIAQGGGTWCPSATITNALTMNAADETIDLENIISLDFVVEGSYAIIGNEIIKIKDVDFTNSQITIARGILDTVPEAHAIGARIYFAGSNYVPVEIEYTNGDQPKIKILTRTANGTLPESSASEITAEEFNSRMIRPYPPGNLKFNGNSYPTHFSSSASNKVAITWNHRDRTHADQLQDLMEHSATSITSQETNTTYTIKVYDEDNSLIRTVTGLTGTNYDYTEAFERSDCGLGAGDPLNETLRFVIYSVRDGYDSFQSYDITLERTLLGTIAAEGDLSGWMVPNLDGRASINPVSLIDGALDSQPELQGIIDGISNINGNLSFPLIGSINCTSDINALISGLDLTGSINGICNTIGVLTTISGSLRENYLGTAEPYFALNMNSANDWGGQSFTTTISYNITQIHIWCKKGSGDNVGIINVELYTVDGFGHPDVKVAQGTISNSAISDSTYGWVPCILDSSYTVSATTKYCIVVHGTSLNVSNVLTWSYDDNGGGGSDFAGGDLEWSTDGGSSWTTTTIADSLFKCYGTDL